MLHLIGVILVHSYFKITGVSATERKLNSLKLSLIRFAGMIAEFSQPVKCPTLKLVKQTS